VGTFGGFIMSWGMRGDREKLNPTEDNKAGIIIPAIVSGSHVIFYCHF
jgi:hypothetical protein